MKIELPQLVACDKNNRIYTIPHLEASGMSGGHFFRLSPQELIKLPYGSQIFMLPDRLSVGYDSLEKGFITLGSKELFAAAAFISPGHTVTYSAAYVEKGVPKPLPLFCYAAVAFYKGSFHAAAIKIDNDRRHDSRYIDISKVKKNAWKWR